MRSPNNGDALHQLDSRAHLAILFSERSLQAGALASEVSVQQALVADQGIIGCQIREEGGETIVVPRKCCATEMPHCQPR